MLNFLLSLFIAFAPAENSQFVVWNVGQGQWSTEIHGQLCLHFDLGGEINIVSKVLRTCGDKQNILFLSHWDWDHISWAPRFASQLKSVCLAKLPAGPGNPRKMKYLSSIPLCSENQKKDLKIYVKTDFDADVAWNTNKTKNWNSNDLSQVYEAKISHVLIPGDSPLSQEIKWRDQVSENIRGLVLSHHGSKTSTSQVLLEHLHLKWAVASARFKKYGHPHERVCELLKKEKVPLLKTEDWGSLHFEN